MSRPWLESPYPTISGGIPATPAVTGRERKRVDDADIDDSRELDDSVREKSSLNCYDGSYEFLREGKSCAFHLRPRLFRRTEFRKLARDSVAGVMFDCINVR